MKTYYGTLNVLEAPTVMLKKSSSVMHPDSPDAIKDNLEISRINEDLFPMLVTGVSCWPFLTLAFSCKQQKEKKEIFKITKVFRKELSGRMIGPENEGTLRPYISMCKKIKNDAHYKALYNFLCKQKKFDGNPAYFTLYKRDKKWQSAFKEANGKQAKAYIGAHKDAENNKTVFDVVTQLLKKNPQTYDETLWYGAFCYAFLRCLFGGYDPKAKEVFCFEDYSVRWKKMLLKILDTKSYPIPINVKSCSQYRRLLNRINNNVSEPPLRKFTQKWRKDSKPILSNLRLGIFHNLYYKPTPSSVQRYLEK